MRVGISWEAAGDVAGPAWQHIVDEAVAADGLGYDSVWIAESRVGPTAVSSPAVFLTYIARKTKSIQLRSVRLVTHANPVRVVEETAVLDVFSRGRAGLVLAAAGTQGVPASRVHETHDFATSAWALDEIRYSGEHIRFPAHTTDDAPKGVSTPPYGDAYLPQWERGPVLRDHLSITPKPYVPMPPTYVEITDEETLQWAARSAVSPYLPASVPTADAVELLSRYRALADAAGRRRSEVEPVIERHVVIDGASDTTVVGGDPPALVQRLRDLTLQTCATHLVWRRRDPSDGDLFRFAAEVQPLLQT